jgi:hypothetical protein
MIRRRSPLVSRDSFAGVGARDVGELTLEVRRDSPAIEPFHFGRRRCKRRIGRQCCAVDDKACTRQRLEGRRYRAIRIEVMRPSSAAAQGQHAILHSEGFVGAQAEFAAGIGDALRIVTERKHAGAHDRGFRIIRQVEGRKHKA